jgi:hypothetical protein
MAIDFAGGFGLIISFEITIGFARIGLLQKFSKARRAGR